MHISWPNPPMIPFKAIRSWSINYVNDQDLGKDHKVAEGIDICTTSYVQIGNN